MDANDLSMPAHHCTEPDEDDNELRSSRFRSRHDIATMVLSPQATVENEPHPHTHTRFEQGPVLSFDPCSICKSINCFANGQELTLSYCGSSIRCFIVRERESSIGALFVVKWMQWWKELEFQNASHAREETGSHHHLLYVKRA